MKYEFRSLLFLVHYFMHLYYDEIKDNLINGIYSFP